MNTNKETYIRVYSCLPGRNFVKAGPFVVTACLLSKTLNSQLRSLNFSIRELVTKSAFRSPRFRLRAHFKSDS